MNREQLSAFTGNLQYRLKLLAQTRRHTDRLLATHFNVFDYIEPNENRLSDVISDLLNPDGAHGQNDVFLREFLAIMCPSPIPRWQFKSVHRESTTSLIENNLRRIDVLADLSSFGVAIENKPWAGERDDQIHDYVTYLDRRFAGNYVIVYLTLDGSKPTSIDSETAENLLQRKQLVLASYGSRFREWLERCYRSCDADKVRWFLLDFMAYAQQTFPKAPEELNDNQ